MRLRRITVYTKGMKTKQTTLGLLIVTAGVLVFLANADVAGVRDWLADWWPLAIAIVGAYMLWVNPRNYVWSLIVMAVGVITLLKTLDVADLNVGMLILPAILVGVGLNMVVAANTSRQHIETKGEDKMLAVLGGSTARNNSSDYTGGSVAAVLGGAELDLSRATIKKEAVLSVSIVMGGLELRVSDNVRIVNRTQSILGGVEDKTRPTDAKANPTLIIEGMVLMGGVEVKR